MLIETTETAASRRVSRVVLPALVEARAEGLSSGPSRRSGRVFAEGAKRDLFQRTSFKTGTAPSHQISICDLNEIMHPANW